MDVVEIDEFCIWLNSVNIRMNNQLKIDGNNYYEDWTEEVIVPEKLYKILSDHEKKLWSICDLTQIYSSGDIFEIFGVNPSDLNKCYSKRFYKLTKNELENLEEFSQKINTCLPVDEILIIYSE